MVSKYWFEFYILLPIFYYLAHYILRPSKFYLLPFPLPGSKYTRDDWKWIFMLILVAVINCTCLGLFCGYRQ